MQTGTKLANPLAAHLPAYSSTYWQTHPIPNQPNLNPKTFQENLLPQNN